MAISRLSARTSAETISIVLGRDGAIIIENLIPSKCMDKIGAELSPAIDATSFGRDAFSGHKTRRTGCLIARSPKCRELIMHPLILDTSQLFFGNDTAIQLHLTQVISISPGEVAQTIHRDQWIYDFFPFPQGYEVQCNTMWALSDFSHENGGTRVVIGSHRSADRLTLSPDQAESVVMKKGSVLIYTGSIYHGGGANMSDSIRMGINITYSRAWLRQEENQYLATPVELASTLPVELLRIMGYARGAPALGYVGNLVDPLVAVRPDLVDRKIVIAPQDFAPIENSSLD